MQQLRTPEQLHQYQQRAVNFQCSTPYSALFMDMGLGKEQPISEPVLTPKGWVKMGDLKVGDCVVGSDGNPVNVIGVFPQGVKPVVKVTFTDNGWCRVGWDHLWYTKSHNQHNRKQDGQIMTTREILNSGLTRKNGANLPNPWWHIPMVQPIRYDAVELPIDPYLLGVILGDGTVTQGGSVTICTDRIILDKCGARYLRDHECDYVGYGSVIGVYDVICSLGLNGKRSWEKFVPVIYLRGSPEQRLALLQGLCDTDGSPITCGGGLEYSSTSEALVDGVVDLTRSLGGIAKKSESRITKCQTGEGRPSWRVNIKLPPDLTPFQLQRKLDKWIRPTKYLPIRKIVSIEEIGVEESRCIMVDASDHLYVTRDYVVTHNTAVTLTSIVHLLNTQFLNAVLIVAPIRVCRLVWRQEALKWTNTKHLSFNMVMGSKDQRTRALMKPANIYVTNFENLKWLTETLQTYYISKNKPLPFDGIVYDELSKCKTSTTDRVKSLMKVLAYFKWRTGLTGTPASNGYKDLHGEFLVLDGGARLGKGKTEFERRFYKKAGPYKLVALPETQETIARLIGDITLSMSAEDYNPLPDLIVNDIEVELPDDVRIKYEQMEKEYFTTLDNGQDVEVFNAASLTNKLLQLSNGAMYPIAGMPLWEPVHDVKLDALEDIIEESEGQQILCAYAYRSDAARIMAKFSKKELGLRPINLTECKSEASLKDAMYRWTTGDCRLLICHPFSAAHGIDGLQKAGNIIVWFGLSWSLDSYDQLNARLRRQGQGKPVICHRITCGSTMDQAQALALDDKANNQTALRNAVKNYRTQKQNSSKNP